MRTTLLAAAASLLAAAGDATAQPKPPPLGAPGPAAGSLDPAGKFAAPGRLDPAGKPPPLGRAEPGPARPGVAPTPQAAPPPAGKPGSAARPPTREVSSGTGFVVAAGRVLTNHHVAAGCAEMRLRGGAGGGAELRATVAATDRQRDLALLTVTGGDPGPPLAFRQDRPARRGEGVVTYGFPLAGLLSSGPTLTTGEVSALAGLRDDPRQIQISAPVQPGNSGGPLLDMAGRVIGVVVSKLNAQRIAQSTGDIPQNVNFAIKGEEAVEFLRRNGVQPRLAGTTAADPPARSATEVGELAHASTVFLRCMR